MSADGADVVSHIRVEAANDETIEFELHALSAAEFADERADLETWIADLDARIDGIDSMIDPLTSHADRLDVGVAVGSGVVAGLVDSLWVGEFSLVRANEWGGAKVNKLVMEVARRNGYQGDSLAGAIRKLESLFPFAGDDATKVFGGGRLHHLRDLTHHPSPVGLMASLMLQFTGQAWGVTFGQLSPVDLTGNPLIGATTYEKMWLGTIKWVAHLISDVAGSSSNAGAGTGLPGPLMSTVYSAAAQWQKVRGADGPSDLMAELEKAFRGADGKVPFDFRTELGLVKEVGRQALPVILNDVIVRAFYFVRRFIAARRDGLGLRESVAVSRPWGNRTIARMLTIATATFTAIDLADAAVRAAIKSGGEPAIFTGAFLFRVNYVGVARTTVAVVVDLRMGVKRSRLVKERAICMNERLRLLDARSLFLVADTWTAAESAERAIVLAEQAASDAAVEFRASWSEMLEAELRVTTSLEDVRDEDPELAHELLDILRGTRHD